MTSINITCNKCGKSNFGIDIDVESASFSYGTKGTFNPTINMDILVSAQLVCHGCGTIVLETSDTNAQIFTPMSEEEWYNS